MLQLTWSFGPSHLPIPMQEAKKTIRQVPRLDASFLGQGTRLFAHSSPKVHDHHLTWKLLGFQMRMSMAKSQCHEEKHGNINDDRALANVDGSGTYFPQQNWNCRRKGILELRKGKDTTAFAFGMAAIRQVSMRNEVSRPGRGGRSSQDPI